MPLIGDARSRQPTRRSAAALGHYRFVVFFGAAPPLTAAPPLVLLTSRSLAFFGSAGFFAAIARPPWVGCCRSLTADSSRVAHLTRSRPPRERPPRSCGACRPADRRTASGCSAG